ncbi:hypothetical protein RJ640_027921 [Escallonia rubra]|uniref:Alpha/beta hydrolase fold-3 domain-containing protein n=1 Tax=Escallonia rubra TaxID=112253 RepID=A0AA88RL65_9ASTE|nr:hypothetical protein RJ640_027921 [Escallonia rubra]
MAIRVGSEETGGFRLAGVVLVHPYFWGKEPIGGEEGIPMEKRGFAEKLWMVAKPSSAGADDPMFNPGMDPELSRVGCRRVLVCVAEKDMFKDRGWRYGEELGGRSGWGGKVEVVESKGEDHVFHLFNPTCDTAVALLTRLASFINQDQE